MVRGVVVTGRLIDRANGRPVQAWVAYAALRGQPALETLAGVPDRDGNRKPPRTRMARAIDGGRELPAGRAAGPRVPRRAHPVSIRQVHPGRCPSEGEARCTGRCPLASRYDTVPFELFPQKFPAVRPVDIAPGTASVTCDLTFDSGVVRTGTVRDPEGRPLAGASMIGETFRNTFRFDPVEGSQFTVYGLSASPLLIRTLIFRHEDGAWARRCRSTATTVARSRSGSSRRPRSRAPPRRGGATRSRASRSHVWRLIDEPTRGCQQEFTPPIAGEDRPGRPFPDRRHRARTLSRSSAQTGSDRGPRASSSRTGHPNPARSRISARSGRKAKGEGRPEIRTRCLVFKDGDCKMRGMARMIRKPKDRTILLMQKDAPCDVPNMPPRSRWFS